MCGIFGIVGSNDHGITPDTAYDFTKDLFRLSESRGKEACGICITCNEGDLNVFKENRPAADLYRDAHFRRFLREQMSAITEKTTFSIVAHARMVTNGVDKINANNQPVWNDNVLCVHNGIVTNVAELWENNSELERHAEVDTEIIAAIVDRGLKNGMSLGEALRDAFSEMEGMASVCMLPTSRAELHIATNCGSLYWAKAKDENVFVFGSEHQIISKFCEINSNYFNDKVHWVEPDSALSINQRNLSIAHFSLTDETEIPSSNDTIHRVIQDGSKSSDADTAFSIPSMTADERILEFNENEIDILTRCSQCVLPETFPFIEFDEDGVCNYCQGHQFYNYEHGRKKLENVLTRYRQAGKRDCIVPLSGGRDSSYGLHLMINEFDMRPITFTYDWGMVTDLARRNISRMCSELRVENILISADIRQKRRFIKKNIEAWLKKPALGIIPLFMAGDKYFFRYVNQIKKDNNIKLDIWSPNRFENTDFKSGFCGIRPVFNKERIDELTLRNKIAMPTYYMKQFLRNPKYLNSSIPDTLGSYWSYYFEPRDPYVVLFDYIPWVEDEVEDCLINQYGWETHPDTKSTWRIGDGTAAFYNYIYFNVAGFTEFDTFRSNQIRAGHMQRNEALAKLKVENRPNFTWIKWYCETNGIDFQRTIETINKIPKLYR